MAEDNLVSLETHEKANAFGPHMRRNSLGSASVLRNGESILPHYLRASTGSCHDFCKYGRDPKCDAKARYSTLKRIKEGSVLPEKQKTVAPPKSLLTSRSFDSSVNFSRSKSMTEMEIKNDGKMMRKTLASISLKTSKTNDPKVKRLESSSSIGKEVSLKKLLLKGREIKLPAKVDTFLRTKSEPVKVKSMISIKEETRPQRNRDLKTAKISGTSNADSKKVLSSPKASLSPKSVGRNVSTRKQNSLKVASTRVYRSRSGKDESDQLHYEEVEEKTLYIVKMETEIKPQILSRNEDDEFNFPLRTLLPSPKSSSLSNSSLLLHDEEGDQGEAENTAKETKEGAFSDIDDKKAAGDMDKKWSSEKMDSPRLSNLNLSRDKVVEIQSQTNSPRKIIFRRARLFGDNQKTGDIRRRKWKKVEEVDRKTADAKPPAEKVILRHQDMQGKKDSRGLFNKVIKETASKLVETRKSKVKALVGAFETVISLQEIKPSATSGS